MKIETMYAVYLTLSALLTVGVGWTLHRHGRHFLIDTFRGNARIADSLNHLLLVGFYLLNFGFVLLWLRMARPPASLGEAIEALALQIGVVLLVLGCIHMFNLLMLAAARRSSLLHAARFPDEAERQARHASEMMERLHAAKKSAVEPGGV